MASMKFDLPLLDYKTRFSLWQVKIRAILAQYNDLDEELDGFIDKDLKTWTDPENPPPPGPPPPGRRLASPSGLFIPNNLKTSGTDRRLLRETLPSSAATKNPSSGVSSSCSGTLSGRGFVAPNADV